VIPTFRLKPLYRHKKRLHRAADITVRLVNEGRVIVRTTVAVTMSCLALVGLAAADDVSAAIRKPTHILAQDLAPALKEFAQARELQVLYFSQTVRGMRTAGASGELTADEALTQLLSGTGLVYRYIDADDKAVTILPAGSVSGAVSMTSDDPNGERPPAQEGKKSSSEELHVAQSASGQSASTAPVAREGKQTSGSPSVQLEEVTVTAQKREERLRNVPISISVLSGPELSHSTFEGVTDALATVPAVATTKNYQGGGTLVAIRGVAAGNPQFEGSSPIAYYLDGVPFGLIKTAIAPDESVYDLRQVEVLRGPQGTLYGASAEGGVVRVLTNDADLQNFNFSVRGSDYATQYGGNSYSGDAMVNVPIVEGALAARAVLGYEKDNGWIDQPNKRNVNDAELRNYRLKLNAQPLDELTIGLSAWSSRDRYGAPSFGYAFDKSSAVLDQPQSTDFDAYGLKIGYRAPWFSISSITSYLDYSNQGTLDLLPFGAPGATWFAGLHSHVLSQEMYLTSTDQGAWRWSVGGMYRRGTEHLQESYTELPVPTIDYLDTSKSYAIFGEVTRLFMDGEIELTLGARHFHDNITQEDQNAPGTPYVSAASTANANTPRVLVAWHPGEQEMIYAAYSQGFRSGFPQNANVPASFAPVQPDKLKNYEIGSKGALMEGRLEYDTALYYIDWAHVQQTITVPFGGVPYPVLVNGEGAGGVGVDFAVSTEPVEGLKLTVNAGWNNLQMNDAVRSGDLILFNKGDRLNFSPETTAGASAAYRLRLGSTGLTGTVSVSANYTSAQIFRLQLAPNFVTAGEGDAMVLSRVAFLITSLSKWEATLFVDNVNNERGTPEYAPVGVVDWSARVRPRTFGVQLSYHLR